MSIAYAKLRMSKLCVEFNATKRDAIQLVRMCVIR